jgi:hypothetical protein
MRHEKFKNNVAFLDVIFNTLLGMTFLFVLAVLLINPPTKKADDPSRKAEYLVTMSWQDDSPHDVDLWMRDSLGNLVSFRNKAAGWMALDRDDLGFSTDLITLPDGSKQIIKINREVITLRGTVKGVYTINVHLYAEHLYTVKSGATTNPSTTAPIVKVIIEKLNPYKIIYEKTVTLLQKGDEETIVNLHIDENKKVTALTFEKYSIFVTSGDGLTGGSRWPRDNRNGNTQ